MTIEIKVPDIGDFDGVEIIEVLVKAGDTVAAEQSIITVESDKASMEIPCPQAGVVKEMKVKIGDKVKEGTLMLILEPAAGGAAAAAPAASEPAAKQRLQKLNQHPQPPQPLLWRQKLHTLLHLQRPLRLRPPNHTTQLLHRLMRRTQARRFVNSRVSWV